jgi:hypothetical protein
MSYRTIAGAAAGGVSYHYDNADAASSGIRYQTIAGAAVGGMSYGYAIVSAASSGFRYTELPRAPPPCARERLVILCPSTDADGRGVRYGAVAGTAVCGVSYFYAIVAVCGVSYFYAIVAATLSGRTHELLNHRRRRRGRRELSLR